MWQSTYHSSQIDLDIDIDTATGTTATYHQLELCLPATSHKQPPNTLTQHSQIPTVPGHSLERTAKFNMATIGPQNGRLGLESLVIAVLSTKCLVVEM